ncbi:MAG: glutamate synthase subunit beta [Lentisphaeria bacterium]|nr:glutamate synthase subunit beta [Lentisphaeria bacterium]
MGKQGGFMEFDRKDPGYRPVDERVQDYQAVERVFSERELNDQAARCMNCGIPFCHGTGCPLGNLIPDWNDAVYKGEWEHAFHLLCSTSSFPEFTARVCPAPCEAACVCEYGDGQPVAIRQIERAIIEYGFEHGLVIPRPPAERTGKKVAVLGAGPAGLTVADVLNKLGHEVTVYDEWPRPGGILRYGIPDFKLEKWVVDRRTDLMAAEGVIFECGVTVGEDVSYKYIRDRFDAICLTGGAKEPRDLPIPGRDLDGIHFAMDFLTRQNRKNDGEAIAPGDDITAAGKRVMVIGGGDTGSDCVGTSIRQGAVSVTQVEIMPLPPDERSENTPWPQWPLKLRTSSSHQEGCRRFWSTSAVEFMGDAGTLKHVKCVEMVCETVDGRPTFRPKPGSEFVEDADLVLLAMGFVGPGENRVAEELDIERDARGNIKVGPDHSTSAANIFSAGDMARGQSLVVRAMADGKRCARAMHAALTA